MNLRDILENEILPHVQKPSRYLGTEVNSVHKDDEQVDVRLALVFPDLYDLGLGNLGILILQSILNDLPWCWAERSYAPGQDMEAELRKRDLKLFALESQDTLDVFDGIGFTLQSELTFTNILNIIDMTGMALRTEDRKESDPLTFAGGPAVFNPEPLAPFMDFFVIGDGEDIVIEIAECLRATKHCTRTERLEALSKIGGVYVPAQYPMQTDDEGAILPPKNGPKVLKRVTANLEKARFPTDYIVPYTQQVHDRVGLEVLRGCTQGCRFCQAGMTTRPVRERSIDKINTLMDETLDNTGYEEVSLVSLSTCDYSRVKSMVDSVARKAVDERVSVSLPSLRLDSFSVDLADRVADVRRSGLTFAPEAASPRLRALINKWIPDEGLLEMADQAFAKGWTHVKLYFMIGLPTERDEDIEAIANLAIRTLEVGRKRNPKARVHLGVSTFVPKPFTPFQWAPQIDAEETHRRQRLLLSLIRSHQGIKFGRHEPHETWLEGLISRSDRRAADIIQRAFELGCRFDAWGEYRRVDLWRQAIEDTGFDAARELRERELDERLPWDHLDVMIPKTWFRWDYEQAMLLKHAEDCRAKRCHKCGVIDVERDLCAHMLRDNIEARKEETDKTYEPLPEPPSPVAHARVRLRIGRAGGARFLSHLETMTAWLRALRRIKAPMAYSQGFHAHPKLTFNTAFPVGESSVGDYMDVELTEPVDVIQFAEALRQTVPVGFHVFSSKEVPVRTPALMSIVEGGAYRITTPLPPAVMKTRVDALMSQPTLEIDRRTKKKWRTIDVRPMLVHMHLDQENSTAENAVLELQTQRVDNRLLKMAEIIRLLDLEHDACQVLKLDAHKRDENGALVSIAENEPQISAVLHDDKTSQPAIH